MMNYNGNRPIPQRKMNLSGKGQVMVTPDLAKIRIGVQTNSASVTTAQEDNARISQEVIDSLKNLGITQIQTVQYQIEQLFDYQNGERIDRGYQVRNLVEVVLDDITLVGTAIDTAVANGANVIDTITFDVTDPEVYYQQALNMAVRDAIHKARNIASSLKSMFDPIPVMITENSTIPIPYSRNIAMREGAFATPIEAGSNQIEASVTVEFIY